MTHEQRIAEIRECLRIPFPSDKEKYPGYIAFLLKQLDTLAAECLRLRGDKERLNWLSDIPNIGGAHETNAGEYWFAVHGVQIGKESTDFRTAIDSARQALDAAKEAK